jgi:hypothetical protein
MRYTAYYFIRPNNALIAALAERDDPFAHLIIEPQLLSQSEGGFSPWSPRDYKYKIKILFLIIQIWEYSDMPEFAEFFGDFRISIQEFDKWWILEQPDQLIEVDGMDEHFSQDIINRIDLTDSPIVNRFWIEALKTRNSTDSP